MGQTYSVCLTAKVKNEAKFVRMSVDYLRRGHVLICKDEDLTTSIGNIKCVMAARQKMFDEEPVVDGWSEYRSYFDASYLWESVIHAWFHAVAPALEDRSEIEVYPDSGGWGLRVKNGMAVDMEVNASVDDEDE